MEPDGYSLADHRFLGACDDVEAWLSDRLASLGATVSHASMYEGEGDPTLHEGCIQIAPEPPPPDIKIPTLDNPGAISDAVFQYLCSRYPAKTIHRIPIKPSGSSSEVQGYRWEIELAKRDLAMILRGGVLHCTSKKSMDDRSIEIDLQEPNAFEKLEFLIMVADKLS